MNTMMRKAAWKLAAIIMTVCLGVLIASFASAADYSFESGGSSDYYPPTDYEEIYGSCYQYGSMNAVDMDTVELPYGYSDGTSIGAAERITVAGTLGSSGVYGAQLDAPFSVSLSGSGHTSVTAESVMPYTYQPNAFTPVNGMTLEDGSIGTVQIPVLGIEVKVWEGETTDSMAKGLGHYSSSSGWDGNVCVCGHNRGAKCAIGVIKDLEIGDTITYTTVYGTRTYAVSYVGIISYTDWSHLQPTADNRITLTTCLANQPESRVCVQAVELR